MQLSSIGNTLDVLRQKVKTTSATACFSAKTRIVQRLTVALQRFRSRDPEDNGTHLGQFERREQVSALRSTRAA
ncbi:hypothetical protein [Rhizobium sp.]